MPEKVKWLKCSVIGDGDVDNPFRPAIISTEEEGFSWSAVYYPSRRPYQFCLVRAKTDKEFPLGKAEELTISRWKPIYSQYPSLQRRWLDQPVYPAKVSNPETDPLDPVETRYLRSDSHTVNTETREKLLTSNSAEYKEKTWSWDGSGSGIAPPPIAYFITDQLGALQLNAATWTCHLWGRVSTLFHISKIIMRIGTWRVESDGTTTYLGSSGDTSNYGTSFSEEDGSWDCPETALESTDALRISVTPRVWTTNSADFTFYFRCGDSTYDSRITNFSYTEAPPPLPVIDGDLIGIPVIL